MRVSGALAAPARGDDTVSVGFKSSRNHMLGLDWGSDEIGHPRSIQRAMVIFSSSVNAGTPELGGGMMEPVKSRSARLGSAPAGSVAGTPGVDSVG